MVTEGGDFSRLKLSIKKTKISQTRSNGTDYEGKRKAHLRKDVNSVSHFLNITDRSQRCSSDLGIRGNKNTKHST